MGKVVGGMLAAALYALTTMAQATLLDRGPDMVYDGVLNITWTRNASLPGSSPVVWPSAKAWAANLVFAGFDDWRLPYASVRAGVGPVSTVVDCATASELACRDNEMGYMFYHDLGGTFLVSKGGTQIALGGQQITGIHEDNYWTGQGNSGSPQEALTYSFFFGDLGSSPPNSDVDARSAWAVRDGDIGAVPEPSSLLLIGVGLLGLAWTRSSRRRR